MLLAVVIRLSMAHAIVGAAMSPVYAVSVDPCSGIASTAAPTPVVVKCPLERTVPAGTSVGAVYLRWANAVEPRF